MPGPFAPSRRDVPEHCSWSSPRPWLALGFASYGYRSRNPHRFNCRLGSGRHLRASGDGINGSMKALRKRRDRVRFVQVRHKEAAAFMACAYAKYTGKPGVCLATSGPGGIHLLNGLYDAKLDGAPVLAITGPLPHSARDSTGGSAVPSPPTLRPSSRSRVRRIPWRPSRRWPGRCIALRLPSLVPRLRAFWSPALTRCFGRLCPSVSNWLATMTAALLLSAVAGAMRSYYFAHSRRRSRGVSSERNSAER
jgi:hypothetical protein